MTRPNVLFVIADDHRYESLGSSGSKEVKTPNLDALAKNGVSFNKMYTMSGLTGAVCVPSRAALHTGVNPFRASISKKVEHYHDLMTLNHDLTTFPKTMRDSGYHTHGIGKWHNDKLSFAEGFNSGGKLMFRGMSDHYEVPVHDFDPTGEYPASKLYFEDQFSTDLFCDEAIRFIDDYQEDKPFFLYLALTAPHDPRTAPTEYAEMYNPEDISVPENFLPQFPFDNGASHIRGEKLAPMPRTEEVIQEHIADYYAMITELDDQLGRVQKTLKEKGIDDNTIIIYTADHGLALGQHGLMAKQSMFEHSLHIPFIMNGPGIPQGGTIEKLTLQYDIYPTVCDMVGVTPPDTVEGESLVPLLTDPSHEIRETVFAVYNDVQRMVRDERWKLIRYYKSESNRGGTDRIQLFDLKNDPWEIHDLSTDPAQKKRIKELSIQLENWQKKVEDPLISSVNLLN